uniref:Uncharacterized protein n=1 Tax=Tolypothrix bouteillei VB521301 TaxID=1479485 RepID=A0A0C1RL49_9CYAN
MNFVPLCLKNEHKTYRQEIIADKILDFGLKVLNFRPNVYAVDQLAPELSPAFHQPSFFEFSLQDISLWITPRPHCSRQRSNSKISNPPIQNLLIQNS